jgi:hypothetical protein
VASLILCNTFTDTAIFRFSETAPMWDSFIPCFQEPILRLWFYNYSASIVLG